MIQNLGKRDYSLLIIGGVTTILATLMLLYLVSSSEVSYVIEMFNLLPNDYQLY